MYVKDKQRSFNSSAAVPRKHQTEAQLKLISTLSMRMASRWANRWQGLQVLRPTLALAVAALIGGMTFAHASLITLTLSALGYPTQKPLALLERIIQASSNEGDVVLDPYMGSGTTIEAAAKHGRRWIGIDVTHHAVATTSSRLKDCGLEVSKDQIIGVPEDLASARQLKADAPRQFDAWCVLEVRGNAS